VLGPHKRAITRSEEELGVDQRAQQGVTRCAVEAPEPLRLSRRQAKPRHLDVLALNTAKNIVECMMCGHWMLPFGS
jgi:hypothetical protein